MIKVSLPPRKNRPGIYKFSELLHQTDEILKSNKYSGIYLDDADLVRDNLDFIDKLISIKYTTFYSYDYSLLKEVNEIVDRDKTITLKLIDDYDNKDRSYIDIESFENTSLEIPLSYAFWVQTSKDLNVNDRISAENLYPSAQTGLSPIKINDLKRIREEIYKLAEKCKGLDDVEKIIMVSDYLQNRVQYIYEKNISESIDGFM